MPSSATFFSTNISKSIRDLAETSVETGKRANQVVAIRTSPGAAGTVVNNLAALGAGTLHALGATGDDGEAFDLRKGLEAQSCSTDGLLRFDFLNTPTYLKPRDVNDPSLAGEHERYDTKNRRPTPREACDKILARLDALLPAVDAVIIADQVTEADCGVVTAAVRHALADRAQQHPKVIFWADSRAHIRKFRQVIIKANQFEAVGHDNPLPDEVIEIDRLREAVPQLRKQIGAPVCVTRGAAGMIVSDPEVTLIPGVKLTGPTDPTGAGDSATAGSVLALCSSERLVAGGRARGLSRGFDHGSATGDDGNGDAPAGDRATRLVAAAEFGKMRRPGTPTDGRPRD